MSLPAVYAVPSGHFGALSAPCAGLRHQNCCTPEEASANSGVAPPNACLRPHAGVHASRSHENDVSTVSSLTSRLLTQVRWLQKRTGFHPHISLTSHTCIARHTAVVEERCKMICFRPLRVSSYELKSRRSQLALAKLNGEQRCLRRGLYTTAFFLRFDRNKFTRLPHY